MAKTYQFTLEASGAGSQFVTVTLPTTRDQVYAAVSAALPWWVTGDMKNQITDRHWPAIQRAQSGAPGGSSPMNYPEGSLIKTAHNDAIFVVYRGIRHWIPDQATFQTLGFNPNAIQTIETSDLNTIKLGIPVSVQNIAQLSGQVPPQPRGGASARPRPAQPTQASGSQAWTVRQGPDGQHAYLRNKDLGLMVNATQVVQPTNGGRLWALGNLRPDGSINWLGSYGSVQGAPPPPNAAANNVPAQMAPPPPPAYAPYGPMYAQPPAPPWVTAPAPYATPAYAYGPAPVYYEPPAAPQPMYPAPAALPPDAYLPPGVQGYDPTAAALYTGAAYGAEAAAQQAAAQAAAQPALDPITASILAGGGVTDMSGDFSGMAGGMDASTLAYLAGGDPNLAVMMAIQNGGYDPTGGMLTAPQNPLPY